MNEATPPLAWHTPVIVEIVGEERDAILREEREEQAFKRRAATIATIATVEEGDACAAFGLVMPGVSDAYVAPEHDGPKGQAAIDAAIARNKARQEDDEHWWRDPQAEPFIRPDMRREAREANPIKLLSYAEMAALPEGEFLIHGAIVRRAKNVLFGASNSFKSFMATDMGGSISTGRTYHGMSVKKCPVIYVANEGANAVGRKRIPAWMAAHEIPQAERGNIYLVNVETILPNKISLNNLLRAIRSIVPPGEDFFLIIDVLRGTMTGSDSDDEAAAAWTMAAEILVKEGATILTLTHSPYSDDGRIRGSSHLWGSFEGRLHAEGDKEKRTCVLKVDRFKDHDSNGQWGFQLDEVEVEEHPGETSLVPRLDGEVKAKKGKPAAAKLTSRAINALDALRYALDEAGAIPPASNHIPGGVKAVTLTQWRTYFDRRTNLDKPDSRLKAFDAGCEKLLAEKVVVIWDIYTWLA
jgi:hypothetical protein